MFGRGFLFIAVLAAAFFIPYALSQQTSPPHQTSSIARWWDSMWTDSIDGRAPISSATPVPNGRPYSGRPSQSTRQYRSPNAWPSTAHRSSMGKLPSYPPSTSVNAAAFQNSALPPTGQTATPWIPVPQNQPGVPSNIVVGPWTPVNSGVTPNGMPRPYSAGQQPSQDLQRYFSFDASPEWVMQNWERVSTEVWDGTLEGMRVALVSGTSVHDLAGSLTYYFDQQQTLQRIAFSGSTGSPEYVKTVATRLGLQNRPSFGGAALVKETAEGVVTDLMRIRPLSGTTKSRFQRYAVVFELNRPGSGQGLSEPLARMLQNAASLPSLDTKSLQNALNQQSAVGPPGRFGSSSASRSSDSAAAAPVHGTLTTDRPLVP